MPLIKSKSKEAFKQNIEAEMDAGKPQKQALAIAYNMKRKARKAKGGEAEQPSEQSEAIQQAPLSRRERAMRAAMAEGGQIQDNYQPEHSEVDGGNVDPQDMYEPSHEGNDVKHNERAAAEDSRSLNQHGAEEVGPQGARMAEGGQITDNYADTEDGDGRDMVGAIMARRDKMYSEGGRVANENSGSSASEPDDMAKDSPNEFDDLALRDDLESSYGEDDNAGDSLDNDQENRDRQDMVDQIMKDRRSKAGKLPNAIKPGLKR